MGTTELNLKAAAAGETCEYTQMYPGMAKTARDEGFAELSEWFETLAKSRASSAPRLRAERPAMKPIGREDVLNLYAYETVRDARGRAVIGHERARRVPVGRSLSFSFEDRETVWFQIQGMCRAERIVDEDRIAEEFEVYNALLPGPDELAATMSIAIGDAAQIQPVLDARSISSASRCPPRSCAISAAHEVALVIDHPNERARAVLPKGTARSLAADLG